MILLWRDIFIVGISGVSLVDKLNGFAVEVAYVSKPETGYTAKMRDVIKEDPEEN